MSSKTIKISQQQIVQLIKQTDRMWKLGIQMKEKLEKFRLEEKKAREAQTKKSSDHAKRWRANMKKELDKLREEGKKQGVECTCVINGSGFEPPCKVKRHSREKVPWYLKSFYHMRGLN